MSDVLRDLSRVQAARPTCHWWRCPRVLAWFRVLMVVSLVKRPASAGLLSRIGDYLLLQHEGLGSDDNRTDSAWHGRHQRRTSTVGTMTRSPPRPLFHRRLREPGYARTRTSRRCGSDDRFVSHSPRAASSTIFRASNVEASASTLRSKAPPSRSYQGWELSTMRRSCTKTSGSASLHATCAAPSAAFV